MFLQKVAFTLCALFTIFMVSRLLMNYSYQNRNDIIIDNVRALLNLTEDEIYNNVIREMNFQEIMNVFDFDQFLKGSAYE